MGKAKKGRIAPTSDLVTRWTREYLAMKEAEKAKVVQCLADSTHARLAATRSELARLLVERMEAEGFTLYASRTGKSIMIGMSDEPGVGNDGLVTLNKALDADPALQGALADWLRAHRPLR